MLPKYSSEKIRAKHKIKYSEDMIKLQRKLCVLYVYIEI